MKHFFKLVILASVVTALIFGMSAFGSKKKAVADSLAQATPINH